jgi:hypothetical protein
MFQSNQHMGHINHQTLDIEAFGMGLQQPQIVFMYRLRFMRIMEMDHHLIRRQWIMSSPQNPFNPFIF